MGLLCNSFTKSGFGLAFTVSDMGYMGFASILFLDFNNKFYKSIDSLILFPMGKLSLPEKSDEGIVSYKDKKCLFLSKLKAMKD